MLLFIYAPRDVDTAIKRAVQATFKKVLSLLNPISSGEDQALEGQSLRGL